VLHQLCDLARGLFRKGKSARDAGLRIAECDHARFFDRVHAKLESKLLHTPSHFEVVVVFRPPGT
jgi:hypothetical protein